MIVSVTVAEIKKCWFTQETRDSGNLYIFAGEEDKTGNVDRISLEGFTRADARMIIVELKPFADGK